MPVGDRSFYLYLHESVRHASAAQVGDAVRVVIEFDTQYCGGPAPAIPSRSRIPPLRNSAAKRALTELAPSRKKEIVHCLSALKSDAARERNIVRALRVVSGETARYIARSW
jgi:hypothetical protein